MARMQKFRGHLYNWYDTRDLRPLEPRYVSSVDSGNLAAHLITLAGAFREWQKNPQPRAVGHRRPHRRARSRARSAARVQVHAGPRPSRADRRDRVRPISSRAASDRRCRSIRSVDDALRAAAERASTLVDMVRTLAERERTPIATTDLVYWVEATRRTIDSWRSDLLARDPAGYIVEYLESLATIALELAIRDGVRLPAGYAAQAAVDRLSLPPTARSIRRCYDLLASEARLASFIAIAKGDIPARHWFRLGRTVTPIGAGAALVSWSGSMFEYLMPDLVLRAPGGSLLAQTSRLIVKRQIAVRRASSTCPGASPSPRTTRAISSSPISIRTSACRASDSSAACPRTRSSRRTPRASPR